MQVLLDRRQRHIHDRHVEHDHQIRDTEHRERLPAPRIRAHASNTSTISHQLVPSRPTLPTAPRPARPERTLERARLSAPGHLPDDAGLAPPQPSRPHRSQPNASPSPCRRQPPARDPHRRARSAHANGWTDAARGHGRASATPHRVEIRSARNLRTLAPSRSLASTARPQKPRREKRQLRPPASPVAEREKSPPNRRVRTPSTRRDADRPARATTRPRPPTKRDTRGPSRATSATPDLRAVIPSRADQAPGTVNRRDARHRPARAKRNPSGPGTRPRDRPRLPHRLPQETTVCCIAQRAAAARVDTPILP